MASAAEQLAANLNLGVFSKATELKQRIWFTLGALIVFRLGTYIPVPGVNASVMAQMLSNSAAGGFMNMLNMFSGGAAGRMTVFALNIMPYISASIIIQLMTAAVPSLEALKKEGQQGQVRLNQYTRYLTVPIAMVQAYGISFGLQAMHSNTGAPVVLDPGLGFTVTAVVSLVGGTMFLTWVGEQITARGVGNGTSLIIMSGIVANLPGAFGSLLELGHTGALSGVFIVFFFFLAVGVIAFIVFIERAYRRVPVQYPKRQVGNRMFGGDSTHMPLKINTSGVIPPIFASSILLIPATVAGFAGAGSPWLQRITALLAPGSIAYMIVYAAMIVFFSFFYTAVVFNPEETADNLKKYGGFVPGIRPGASTAQYFDFVLSRLTVLGGLYLVAVCLLPQILITDYGLPFYFGGTSILIVVSVMMDTVTQIQSHLIAHQYEGLIKKSRAKGRK